MQLRKDQSILLIAGVLSLAIWLLPLLRPILLPLQYYNTHVHELAHALATVLTGGAVEYVSVFANGGGVTLSAGGFGPLIASAGYVGSAIVGGMLLLGSRDKRGAQTMLYAAAAFLAFSMLFFVRGDFVGVLSGLLWIAGLALAALKLNEDHVVFVAKFLGVQQCLTSLQSIFILLQLTAMTNEHNDAQLMAQETMIPAIVWSVLWGLMAIGVIAWGLKVSWGKTAKPRRTT